MSNGIPEMVRIGGLALRWPLIAYVVSLVIAYYITKRLLSADTDKPTAERITGIFINAILLAALLWKFAPFAYNPAMLWERPMAIIMMTGSAIDLGIGALAGAIYSAFALRKNKISSRLAGDTLSYAAAIIAIASSILQLQMADNHPVFVYKLVIGVGILLWMRRKGGTLGSGAALQLFLLGGGLGWMGITLAARNEAPVYLFTIDQWVCLGMVLLSLFVRPRVQTS